MNLESLYTGRGGTITGYGKTISKNEAGKTTFDHCHTQDSSPFHALQRENGTLALVNRKPFVD
jgi:hypothetical protein